MINTYPDDAPIAEKQLEETRCLRCVLERILRVMDEGLFVDYQMEKFGKDRAHAPIIVPTPGNVPSSAIPPAYNCQAMKDLMRQYPNGYVGDTPCTARTGPIQSVEVYRHDRLYR